MREHCWKVDAREAVSEDEKPLIDTLEADWVINRHCKQRWIQITIDCPRQIDVDHHPKICPGWLNWLLLLFLGRNTSSLVPISPFLIWHLNKKQCCSQQSFWIDRLGTPQTPSALPFSWALLRGSFLALYAIKISFWRSTLSRIYHYQRILMRQ